MPCNGATWMDQRPKRSNLLRRKIPLVRSISTSLLLAHVSDELLNSCPLVWLSPARPAALRGEHMSSLFAVREGTGGPDVAALVGYPSVELQHITAETCDDLLSVEQSLSRRTLHARHEPGFAQQERLASQYSMLALLGLPATCAVESQGVHPISCTLTYCIVYCCFGDRRKGVATK